MNKRAVFFKAITPATRTPTVKVKEGNAQAAETSPTDVKAGPINGNFAQLLSLVSAHNPGGDFGPHNVEEGHHVAFNAGSFTGSGKVTATGRDGLVVQDAKQREHRVHWREVTGHFAPEKDDDQAQAASPKKKADANEK